MTGSIRFALPLAFLAGLAFAAAARADDQYVDPGKVGCSDGAAPSSEAVPASAGGMS